MAKNDGEKITLTRAQLKQMIGEAVAEDKMDPDEKKIRGIIGEVIEEKLSKFFDNDDDPADDDPADDDEEKPGLLKQVLGIGA